MSKEKKLLIVEKSDFKLLNKKVENSPDGKKYIILEGVFAVLNEKNRNNRIYTKDQYIPQIDRLQEKINLKSLLGELNHPLDRFDVDLNNVSHVIESLKFVESENKVFGTIRLLNTDKGITAQRLVEDGIPLHISSRAAGSVNPDGTVQMKHLFTYDLVAEPGFAQAQLNIVNEKYGFDQDGTISLYEIDSTSGSEEETTDAEAADAIVKKEEELVVDKKCKKNEDKSNIYNKNESDMNYVSEEQFEKYTSYLKSKIEELNEKLDSYSSNDIQTKQNSISKSTVKLEEKYDKLVQYVEYLKEQVNNSIMHNDHIVENVLNLTEYVNYAVENLDKNISYTKYLSETVDNSISYTKYVGDILNKTTKYTNYIAENFNGMQTELNNNKLYMEYVARSADKGIQYTEYLAEQVDNGIQYSEHIGVKVNESIGYNKYLGKTLNKSINYSNYLAESMSDETVQQKQIETGDYKQTISRRLDAILEKSSNKELESDTRYHFLKFLDTDRVSIFSSLNESAKDKVINAFIKNNYYSASDAISIFENSLKTKDEQYIEMMKPHHKELWSRLDEGKQELIKLKSNNYILNTQERIDNFWDSIDLRKEKVDFQPINENEKPVNQNTNGQKDNYLLAIEEQLAGRMRR